MTQTWSDALLMLKLIRLPPAWTRLKLELGAGARGSAVAVRVLQAMANAATPQTAFRVAYVFMRPLCTNAP